MQMKKTTAVLLDAVHQKSFSLCFLGQNHIVIEESKRVLDIPKTDDNSTVRTKQNQNKLKSSIQFIATKTTNTTEQEILTMTATSPLGVQAVKNRKDTLECAAGSTSTLENVLTTDRRLGRPSNNRY